MTTIKCGSQPSLQPAAPAGERAMEIQGIDTGRAIPWWSLPFITNQIVFPLSELISLCMLQVMPVSGSWIPRDLGSSAALARAEGRTNSASTRKLLRKGSWSYRISWIWRDPRGSSSPAPEVGVRAGNRDGPALHCSHQTQENHVFLGKSYGIWVLFKHLQQSPEPLTTLGGWSTLSSHPCLSPASWCLIKWIYTDCIGYEANRSADWELNKHNNKSNNK